MSSDWPGSYWCHWCHWSRLLGLCRVPVWGLRVKIHSVNTMHVKRNSSVVQQRDSTLTFTLARRGGINGHSWGRRGIPSFYFLLGIKMNADKLCCHLLSGATLHVFKRVCLIEHTQPPPHPPTLSTPPQHPYPGSLSHQNGHKMYSTSSSSHLPKAVPAQGPRSRFQRQNEDVCECAHSRTALITAMGNSCFQSCVFQPRGPCFTLFPQLYFEECFPDCPP